VPASTVAIVPQHGAFSAPPSPTIRPYRDAAVLSNTTWGEKGFLRMEKDISDKRGMCGLAMQPSYPTA